MTAGRSSSRLGALGLVGAAALVALVVFSARPGHAQTVPTLPGATTTTTQASTTTTTTQPSTTVPTTSPASTAPPTTAFSPPTTVSVVTTPDTAPIVAVPLAPQASVPVVAPRSTVAPSSQSPAPAVTLRRTRLASAIPSGIVVAGTYGMSVSGTLAIAMLLIVLATLVRSQGRTVALTSGGTTMDRSNRTARLSIGFGCLAAAGIVAVIGYLGLSRNPDVNRQIPYLASAGMAVVILAAIGGSFIVAEQLRNDNHRLAQLEEAVRLLAAAVAPALEAPARVGASKAFAPVESPVATPSAGVDADTDEAATPRRRSRSAAAT